MHVIDCLPNVWMLDGRLVTSAERLQVQQFFQESALCNRPVVNFLFLLLLYYPTASRLCLISIIRYNECHTVAYVQSVINTHSCSKTKKLGRNDLQIQ